MTASPTVLAGKRVLVVGVANDRSIAWGVARAMHNAGARVALTYANEKARPHVAPLAEVLGAEIFLPMDVRVAAEQEAVFAAIAAAWGGLDALVHSIAFAPKEALQGRVIDCPLDGFSQAMDISCHSFLRLARAAEPLMTDGGVMMTMTYLGAVEVIDNYGIMGPVKAALESCVRYLAAELGPKGITVHAISPGPLDTRAGGGIKDFGAMMENARRRAPARRLVTIEEVGAACAFLASDFGRGMTGETLYIDGGYHITG